MGVIGVARGYKMEGLQPLEDSVIPPAQAWQTQPSNASLSVATALGTTAMELTNPQLM